VGFIALKSHLDTFFGLTGPTKEHSHALLLYRASGKSAVMNRFRCNAGRSAALGNAMANDDVGSTADGDAYMAAPSTSVGANYVRSTDAAYFKITLNWFRLFTDTGN